MKKTLCLLLLTVFVLCSCNNKETTLKTKLYSGYDFSAYFDQDEEIVIAAIEKQGFQVENTGDLQYRFIEEIQGIEVTVEFVFWQFDNQENPILVQYSKIYNKTSGGSDEEQKYKEGLLDELFEHYGAGIDNNTDIEVDSCLDIENKEHIHISWWGDNYEYIAQLSVQDIDESFDILLNVYGPFYGEVRNSLTSIGDK